MSLIKVLARTGKIRREFLNLGDVKFFILSRNFSLKIWWHDTVNKKIRPFQTIFFKQNIKLKLFKPLSSRLKQAHPRQTSQFLASHTFLYKSIFHQELPIVHFSLYVVLQYVNSINFPDTHIHISCIPNADIMDFIETRQTFLRLS